VSELVGPASSSTAGTTNVSGLSDPDLLNIASTTAQSLGIGTITFGHPLSNSLPGRVL
jgi:hypothetical protein